MRASKWKQADSIKAKQIWKDYQKKHDLTARIGQTAGIDPKSGQIWFGQSIREIVLQRKSEGYSTPLFFERGGSQAYFTRRGYQIH